MFFNWYQSFGLQFLSLTILERSLIANHLFHISSSYTLVKMAKGIKNPPKFDDLNFPIQKVKMTVFLQSLGSRVAKVVTKPFSTPLGDEDTWSDIATKEFDANSRAHLPCFKLIMMMTLHESYTANPHMRFGLTFQSLMKEHHKLRGLKLTSYIPNMKTSLCMKMSPLMIWL